MSRAVVRPPTRVELERAAYVAQVAFNSPDIDPWVRSYEWIADNRGLDYLVVVEADGQIVSSLLCTPGEAYFSGDVVPLSAVGGVATLPDYRKFGYAGLMMEESVGVLHRHGYCTSALWPFSYHYYRRYGWEIASEMRIYEMDSEFAEGLGPADGVRPARESDLPGITALVDRFTRGRNAVTVRDDLWWSCILATYGLDLNADKAGTGICVHEAAGAIDGYAFYVNEGEGDDETLRVKELIADYSAARRAILSWLGDAGKPRITFPAPVDDDFLQELPNPRQVTTTVHGGFQFRVVDPVKALEARTVPPGVRGRLGFEISDPVLPDSSFDIEVEDGRIRAVNSRDSERLTMDVQTFAQLFSGYISPERAAELGRLRTGSHAALQLAAEVLHRGQPFRSHLEIG